MPRDPSKTRAKILAAATKLFYEEGIRAVSVDAVAEKAGVTKRTLYYHFKSKDDLVAAYLEGQDQPTLALYKRWYDESDGGPEAKIRGLFHGFATAAGRPRWRGCGFQRTVSELAGTPGHPAVRAGALHKKRFEAWLAKTLAEAGVLCPEETARQVLVVLEGAVVTMQIHRDAAYVEAAGEVAASLIRSAAKS